MECGSKMDWSTHLSKSNFVQGAQCPKAVWLYKNRKDLKPPISEQTQGLFDQGNRVGELARKLYPGGELVDFKGYEVKEAHARTIELVKKGVSTIYEATAYDDERGLSAKADILTKTQDNTWHLLEVKSSTKVKEEHILDVAFQFFVFSKRNYKISAVSIVFLDNQYSKDGEIEISELLKLEDVTERVLELQAEIQNTIDELKETLSLAKEPLVLIGAHCQKPYECDYKAHCWKEVPDYSVLDLFQKKVAWKLAQENGSFEIEKLSTEQIGAKGIDVDCYKSGETYVDKEALEGFISELIYPLYFFDYETVSTAIPLFEKSKPFQQVPFQYSLHIQREPGGELEHREFLYTEKGDPRPELIKSLISDLGEEGSVVVYWRSFEETRNKELAEYAPERSEEILAINERIVDLIVPFKKKMIYSPKQKSSNSIKKVLPAYTDLSYEDEEIEVGDIAALRYKNFQLGQLTSEESEQLFKALRSYCKLDTFSMVKILASLEENAK